MFDNTRARRSREQARVEAEAGMRAELDQQGVTSAEPGSDAANRMDDRWDDLQRMLEDERDRQAENRYQMSKDEDYYDGLQWEPEDAQALLDRGQAPLVFNKVRPTVEWVLGTEKRTRVDFKILPREQGDEQGAEVKTKVLKYVGDVNRVGFARSAAFAESVTAGLGWLEDGINTDPESELIYSGSESWRNVYNDSRDRSLDLSQSRYLFRQRSLDSDVAKAMFPQARGHIDQMASSVESMVGDFDDPWYLGERLTNVQDLEGRASAFGLRSAAISSAYVDAGRRDVVRIIETWYRIPESVEFFNGGPFQGKPFDQRNPQHVEAKRAGVPTFWHVAMRMRCMIGTESAPLWDGPSWYRHNRFPFTPLWCYRRKRDGMPYGIVRGIRDPQDDFNKRRSKALHILSTNRVIADDDAVSDPELLRDEASRSDGVILKRPGRQVEFLKPMHEITGNLELMHHDEVLIQDVSGVQSELLGKQTNAQSGKAIIARQEQGSMVTASIFDNLRLAIQLQGEKQLSLAEQYFVAPKVIRIVGDRRPTEWVPINTVDPQTGQVLNDITARQADFVVSEQDYRASLQQAAFEQMADMLSKVGAYAPQLVVSVLDLLIDLADIPNKDEFVSRIRKATGQSDPTKPPTPEETQAQQQAQQQQQMQQQMQMETLAAQLKQMQANAKLTDAKAVTEHVSALLQAIQAGGQVASMPNLAPIADAIAQSAGFSDQQGADPNIPQPAAAPAQPQQPPTL